MIIMIPFKKHVKLHITDTYVVKKCLFVWLNMNHCLSCNAAALFPEGTWWVSQRNKES